MNGIALPSDHGDLARVVVPGVAGARSVKWLDIITVQDAESQNFYQRHDYKVLPPDVADTDEAEKYWDTVRALQDVPVNSVIGVPESGDTVRVRPDKSLEVKGYALPHGPDGPVFKAEISVDNGVSWQEAQRSNDPEGCGRWTWGFWRARVALPVGRNRKILSRATDNGENVQEKHPLWNLKGVAYNGHGEVRNLTVDAD